MKKKPLSEYERYFENIQRLIVLLKDQLALHRAEANALEEGHDWSYVGDLVRIRLDLKNIIEPLITSSLKLSSEADADLEIERAISRRK